MHPLNSSKPQLSISLLISNRPDTIPRCLDSLQPIRKAIPSELILVDTSGSNEIHQLLLTYTEQVYTFQWCNDFAKARNVGINHAIGEWFMFMDDDEWFVDPQPLIDFFKTGEYKNYGMVNHRIRNFLDVRFSKWSDAWVTRLIRLDEDVCFEGKIHEAMRPIKPGLKQLGALSYHSGYVYYSKEEKEAHYNRNVSLLLKMIEEEPTEGRWYLQLIQEYCAAAKWTELKSICKKSIETLNISQVTEYYKGPFYAGYAMAEQELGNYDECISLCKGYIKREKLNEMTIGVLHYLLATCYAKKMVWKKTEMHMRKYLDVVDLFERESERLDSDRNSVIVNLFYDVVQMENGYRVWIQAALEQGKVEPLCTSYQKLGWDKTIIHVEGNLEDSFLKVVATQPYNPVFTQLIELGYRNRGLRYLFQISVELWGVNDEEGYRKIIYAQSLANLDDEYIWYAKMCMAYWNEEQEAFSQCLSNYMRTKENVFMIPSRVLSMTEGIDLYEHLRYVEADRWKKNVAEYIANASSESIKKTKSIILEKFGETHWKYQYYCIYENRRIFETCKPDDITYLEKLNAWVNSEFEFYSYYYLEKCFAGIDNPLELYHNKLIEEEKVIVPFETESYDDVILVLHHFMLAELEYALCIYQDAAFEGDMELLPPEIRGAVCINNMFGREAGDWRGMLMDLKECVKNYPALAENVRYLTRKMSELVAG